MCALHTLQKKYYKYGFQKYIYFELVVSGFMIYASKLNLLLFSMLT
jgi:hypothetical protein